MKPISSFYTRKKNSFPRLVFTATITTCLLLCFGANAKFRFEGNDSTNTIVSEKKVDYLERLYFSGSDKEELDVNTLVTIQDIQNKLPTIALAKQLTFLLEVQEKISAIGNTCDALDLLAVGIYQLDAAEAARQGVKMPSNKAKEKSGDAIAALNKLSNSAYNTSSSATSLAWTSIIYSNGKYTAVASKAGKVAKTAGTLGNVAGTAGKVLETGKQAKEVFEKFIGGGKKKKACDDVPQKEIVIGEHTSMPDASKVINTNTATPANSPVVAASAKQEATPSVKTIQSKITINAVSQVQLQSILSSITKIPGVTSAESDSYSKNIAVLLVDGNLKVGELTNKIVDACKPLKLTVDSYSNSSNSADLLLKP